MTAGSGLKASLPSRDEAWALALAALALIAVLLVGGVGPLPSIPVAALLTAAVALVGGVLRMRRLHDGEPFLAAAVALAVTAAVSATFVLLVVVPCGADCL